MEGSVYQVPLSNNVPNVVKGKDLVTLLVASMQTLKRSNKRCGEKKFPI